MKANGDGQFRTTCWDLVRAAADPGSADYEETWQRMVAIYHSPLYVYLRRKGQNPEDAQDLVQELFLRLSSKGIIATADEQRGKFRSWLIRTLKNLSIDEFRSRVTKQGTVLQFKEAEFHFQTDLAPQLTPEEYFDRRCAIALMDRALFMVRETVMDKDRFDQLKSLIMSKASDRVVDAAARIGVNENVVNQSLIRWRRQWAKNFYQLVAESLWLDHADEESRPAILHEIDYFLGLVGRE